jgi:energy-coupling factor transporter ATP-binding protein EcfA2
MATRETMIVHRDSQRRLSGNVMDTKVTIRSVRFRNFKALGDFSLNLRRTNILVGPNNSGKSTVLSAFRVLAHSLRRAGAKSSMQVSGPEGYQQGYPISKEDLPVSLENVHTNYSSDNASVIFTLSNGTTLALFFPGDGGAYLIMPGREMTVTRPSQFRTLYPISVGVVPVLGPVEHEEQLLQRETVDRALSTHRASRHFRNYWHYNPEGFQRFQQHIEQTWRGMSIKAPEVQYGEDSSTLVMFCSENRLDRELYWVGFGFQVWCQLLTHVLRAKQTSILVVDEPEIYLHPDIQRQLLGILKSDGPDLLLATHSSELISEAEPSDIVLVDKAARSGKRLVGMESAQTALEYLGSGHNITLTQLCRTRRVLFVEGDDDFRLLRRWAAVIGLKELASGLDIVPVPVGGFAHWKKLESIAWGLHRTLGQPMLLGAVLDRDYYCIEEIAMIAAKLKRHLSFLAIHEMKEIENYLLMPEVLDRCVHKVLRDRSRRKGKPMAVTIDSASMLDEITIELKDEIISAYIAKVGDYYRLQRSAEDTQTVTHGAVRIFHEKWSGLRTRLRLVPGKVVLARFNARLQSDYGVSVTPAAIIHEAGPSDVPADLLALLKELDAYRSTQAPEWAKSRALGEDSLDD